MSGRVDEYFYKGEKPVKLVKWKVRVGSRVSHGTVLLLFQNEKETENSMPKTYKKLKCTTVGTVQKLVAEEEAVIKPGQLILYLESSCPHSTVMKDLCAECGADLRQLDSDKLAKVTASTSVSMVHSIPELRVSHEQAQQLGQADEERLLKSRKLVLLVDLDQTLIHTTNEDVPPDMKNVTHFQLYGPHSPWYHTRLRPGTMQFLEQISKLYELHICTFGARPYAHKIASILDPQGKLFSHRILSRDECFNPTSKTGNLKALFPRGDSMVCIIDDREDVWNYAPNMIPVKPYSFFHNTGDINAPPGLPPAGDAERLSFPDVPTPKEPSDNVEKTENKDSEIVDAKGREMDENGAETAAKKPEESTTDQNGTNAALEQKYSENKIESNEDKENAASNESTRFSAEEDSQQAVSEKMGTSDDSEKDGRKTPDSSEDADDYLIYLEEILTTIHTAYFDIYDQMKSQGGSEIPDLKNVIPYVRRKVLKGVNIVFSGVIPTNMPPEKSKLWNLAKSLGANVTTDLVLPFQNGPMTTHVIAAKMGTAKVNRAKRIKEIKIVSPDWLWSCSERWEHVDERLFPLAKENDVKKASSQYRSIDHRTGFPFVNQSSLVPGKVNVQNACPIYDPVTGKRIRIAEETRPVFENRPGFMSKQAAELGSGNDPDQSSSASYKLQETYNPLLAFSSEDLAEMDKEVDDACSGDSEDEKCSDVEKENEDKAEDQDLGTVTVIAATTSLERKRSRQSDSESSSVESLTGGECPLGWKKRKKSHQNEDEALNEDGKEKDDFGGVIDTDGEESATLFPRRELPYDSDKSEDEKASSDDFNESIGSVDEEMAAAVEREFLGS